MRALTIRQPWAEQILTGTKRREYRSWRTDHRGPLVIHAAARPDLPLPAPLPLGAYVGVVMLRAVHRRDDGFAWILEDPWRLPHPIPGKGRLGFFHVPEDVAAELPRRYRDAAMTAA